MRSGFESSKLVYRVQTAETYFRLQIHNANSDLVGYLKEDARVYWLHPPSNYFITFLWLSRTCEGITRYTNLPHLMHESVP